MIPREPDNLAIRSSDLRISRAGFESLVGDARGLRFQSVDAEQTIRSLTAKAEEYRSELESLRADILSRDEERDDMHRRFNHSQRVGAHLNDQVRLCERRIDELERLGEEAAREAGV